MTQHKATPGAAPVSVISNGEGYTRIICKLRHGHVHYRYTCQLCGCFFTEGRDDHCIGPTPSANGERLMVTKQGDVQRIAGPVWPQGLTEDELMQGYGHSDQPPG